MVRRPVAFVTAIVLFVEAVGIVIVNGVLATVAGNQSMSLAGMDPDAMVHRHMGDGRGLRAPAGAAAG